MSQLSADSVPDAADVGGTGGRSVNPTPPTAVPTAPVPMLIPEYPAAEAVLNLGNLEWGWKSTHEMFPKIGVFPPKWMIYNGTPY